MSGGRWDYIQHRIDDIADDISDIIKDNNRTDKDEWGYIIGRHYNKETIKRLKIAAKTISKAAKMMQRVDWLLSDDDGEDSFKQRWDKEIKGD